MFEHKPPILHRFFPKCHNVETPPSEKHENNRKKKKKSSKIRAGSLGRKLLPICVMVISRSLKAHLKHSKTSVTHWQEIAGFPAYPSKLLL